MSSLSTPRETRLRGPSPNRGRCPRSWRIAAALGASLSTLGKTLYQGMREYAEQNNIEIEGLPKDPKADLPPEQLLPVLRNFFATFFPLLAPAATGTGPEGVRQP